MGNAKGNRKIKVFCPTVAGQKRAGISVSSP